MTHEKLTATDRFERHGATHWRDTITGRVLPRMAGGAPVATAPKALQGKLAEVESDIDRLKGERHEAHQRFTKARAEFAEQPGYNVKGEHYRRAEAASAAVAAVDEKIAGAKSAQVAIRAPPRSSTPTSTQQGSRPRRRPLRDSCGTVDPPNPAVVSGPPAVLTPAVAGKTPIPADPPAAFESR